MIHVVRALTFQRLVSLYSGSIIIILFDSLSRKKWFANKIRRTSHIHNQYLIFNLLKFIEDRNLLSYNFRKIRLLLRFSLRGITRSWTRAVHLFGRFDIFLDTRHHDSSRRWNNFLLGRPSWKRQVEILEKQYACDILSVGVNIRFLDLYFWYNKII